MENAGLRDIRIEPPYKCTSNMFISRQLIRALLMQSHGSARDNPVVVCEKERGNSYEEPGAK